MKKKKILKISKGKKRLLRGRLKFTDAEMKTLSLKTLWNIGC